MMPKRGRKPYGEKAMSNAEKQKRFRSSNEAVLRFYEQLTGIPRESVRLMYRVLGKEVSENEDG